MQTARDFILPIEGTAFVFWGGDTKELNYHHNNAAQKYAFDFSGVPKPGGIRWTGNGIHNEDFFIFSRRILAPCDGIVVEAIDGVRDNTPKKMNNYMAIGNAVMLRHAESIFSVFAHLKQGSVSVHAGDIIRQGQLIGLCGNSGRSTEPHLHFHVQTTDDINEAHGLKCYFRRLRVDKEVREDYSPIKREIVANA
jgi:hypothetical protein